MEMMKTAEPIRLVLDDGANLPVRGHKTDAGLDLFSREDVTIWGGMSYSFDTGVHVELPEGSFGLVTSKSGLNVKNGIICPPGIIDEGYTGSICVKLYNMTGKSYRFHKGEKIAQLLILPYIVEKGFEVVSELEPTDRGNKGFGSTGK